MAYTPYYPSGWDDSPSTLTPIIAAALNNIETGIGAAAVKANNLSDLASSATARTNLGLGSAATQSSAAFDAANSVSGRLLAAPLVLAPAGQTTYTVTLDTLAAWSTGVVCTPSFTAPASGDVIVEISFGFSVGVAGYDLMVALSTVVGGTSIQGVTQTIQASAASTLQQAFFRFYVSGLTPGNVYQFDLLGACAVSGGGTNETGTMYTYGGTSGSVGSKGYPYMATVRAV